MTLESKQYVRFLKIVINRAFADAVSKEVPAKLREIQIGGFTVLIHALTSLIIFPYGALTGMKDILVSALRVLQRDSLASDIQNRINERVGALRRRAAKALGGEKPTLLNFIEELKAQYMRQL